MLVLHKAGASVNAQDDEGYTLLITAAVNGSLELTDLVLTMHPAMDLRSVEKKTALDYARQLGYWDIEKRLLENGAH